MTLATKVASASKTVGGRVKADKRNHEQNYDYISSDSILAYGGQALAEQGVALFPAIVEATIDPIVYKRDDRGQEKVRYDARVQFIMRLSDDSENIKLAWVGLGSDYAVPDKALYKAITSGHKYFLAKLLSIGEGNEDGEHEPVEAPEAHTSTDKPQPVRVTTGPVPNCPKCNGPMWDNRQKNAERAAAGQKAMPEFSCKNKDGCGTVLWPPKDGASNGSSASTNDAAKASVPAKPSGPITPDQIKRIQIIADKLYKSQNEIGMYRKWMKDVYGVESSKDLTQPQAAEVIKSLEAAELERAALTA